MATYRTFSIPTFTAIALVMQAGTLSAQDNPPIVQPGAPGKPAQALDASKATEIAKNSYSRDDVRFMQDMIPHHNQAVQMAALVKDRTNNAELTGIAGRIDASQADEIKFMSDWLAARGEEVPEATAHHAMHMSHDMAGMASPAAMAALADASSTEFDRLFLTLMIDHHEGAITMVRDLLSNAGSAYDPVLFQFVNDIVNDQTSEINRMTEMLADLSSDPRTGLKPGFRDAGEAISNMDLLMSLPRPAGFFDPDNPSDLPPVVESDDDEDEEDEGEDGEVERGERAPFLSFSNTDMAFSGNKLVAGSYHGFNVYELAADGMPELFSSVVCPGGQGDVSIVGDLLIMSVEQTRGRVDCGLQGIEGDVSADRFRGVRIFDISNLRAPIQVGQVQTCRGSHTHSVVSSDDEKIVVYNSGTSRVRSDKELEGCVDGLPGDDQTALFSIDVIEIPVNNPAAARIVDSPRVFADPDSGVLAGLWTGGDHGDGTQTTAETDQCHDITVFPAAKIAAGACSGNGIIFDISDPLKPVRIDAVTDPGFAYWHSATFNNDGTKVLFTDEWGGGGRPRCMAHDPQTWGADVFYDIVDRKLEYKGRFKIPAPQTDTENCVAHNGSAVPVPGRDVFVQAWYQGGISVIDFTDSENPVEIAYFDRGPIHEDVLITGGYWSAYWYNGKIYGTEIVRGLDVLSLKPSEHLTANEIAAAELADQGDIFNPQQQFQVTWPAEPVVAMAYLDQMERSGAMDADTLSAMRAALGQAQASLDSGNGDMGLAENLQSMAGGLGDSSRATALGETLMGIAAKLR
ncbi:MAG: DUF305 domain-containing protein [Kordiimonadaceae bacterium]|nr:DUF305 domain-containing protein [Kordiimonadaceae bacterium]MBO6568891.1 DUF305 domain-containing protein [Kordiimonadaceae bacterium]MBO6965134.1 DUF305 domain-containing protein [Kordiimonadaceae bacterium]